MHKITVRPDSKHDREKFLMACTCGTEGRFLTELEAMDYARMHAQHYGLLPNSIIELSTPTPPAPSPVSPPAPGMATVKEVTVPAYALKPGVAAPLATSQVPPYARKG